MAHLTIDAICSGLNGCVSEEIIETIRSFNTTEITHDLLISAGIVSHTERMAVFSYLQNIISAHFTKHMIIAGNSKEQIINAADKTKRHITNWRNRIIEACEKKATQLYADLDQSVNQAMPDTAWALPTYQALSDSLKLPPDEAYSTLAQIPPYTAPKPIVAVAGVVFDLNIIKAINDTTVSIRTREDNSS